jgi:hypothetical protein
MKRLIFLISMVACFAVQHTVQAQKMFDIYANNDTLTNQTTKTYLTSHSGGPALLDVPYYYSVQVYADSLSGSNAGTAYLQVCNDRSGTNWITLQSLTIDGTGTDSAIWEGIAYGRRMRIYYDMPSGTRKVRARVYAMFKRLT